MSTKQKDKFRSVLDNYISIDNGDEIQFDRPLTELGLDSVAVIQLMIDIEMTFDVVFPDELLSAETFETAGSLWAVVESLMNSTSDYQQDETT